MQITRGTTVSRLKYCSLFPLHSSALLLRLTLVVGTIHNVPYCFLRILSYWLRLIVRVIPGDSYSILLSHFPPTYVALHYITVSPSLYSMIFLQWDGQRLAVWNIHSVSFFPSKLRVKFRPVRAGSHYRSGFCSDCYSCSEGCTVECLELFSRVLTKIVYIYNPYGRHTFYFCNWNIPNSKPYICSTTFDRAMFDANGVPNKLFLSFLFSDPGVGVHFLKMWGYLKQYGVL